LAIKVTFSKLEPVSSVEENEVNCVTTAKFDICDYVNSSV